MPREWRGLEGAKPATAVEKFRQTRLEGPQQMLLRRCSITCVDTQIGQLGSFSRYGSSRPKSHFNKKGLKLGVPVLPRADVTNCVKGVEDALNGIAYVDDRQLCSVTATKAWGEEAFTRVRIS